MNTVLKVFVLLVALIGLSQASLFFRGRRFHHHRKQVEQQVTDIPEQYYDQRLDHFNEALTTTWKQVNHIFDST